jgi:hypothetical protein
MERKWLIAIIIIAIVIIGVFGWYFLFGTQNVTPKALAMVYIDARDYTTPLTWNLNADIAQVAQEPHNITNSENNATSISLSFTVWHLEGTEWVEQFNGTKWLVNNATVTPTIIVEDNATGVVGTKWANKPLTEESSTYQYSLLFNDKTIYLNLNYLGNNPTVDGQTVFAYAAFDINGNGTLNPSDKAFNFTSNPNLPTQNELRIYTPADGSSWNTTSTDYVWNGTVSSDSAPIKVLCSDNRTNITFALPFSYIGATKGGKLGFVLQAFSHDWVTSDGKAATPSNYIQVPGGLSLPPVNFFTMKPHQTLAFYTKAMFTSVASGDYRVVFEFQATVQSYS